MKERKGKMRRYSGIGATWRKVASGVVKRASATNFVAKATKVNHGKFTQIIYLLHTQNPLSDARISEISHTYAL